MADRARKAGDAFSVEQLVAAAPEAVWACLLRPGDWWAADIEFDPRPGGSLIKSRTDSDGSKHTTNGAVIAFHPPFGMVLSWADDDWLFDTIVAIRIDKVADGSTSRVFIDHEGWANAPKTSRKALVSNYRASWVHHLQNLAKFAETKITERNRGNLH